MFNTISNYIRDNRVMLIMSFVAIGLSVFSPELGVAMAAGSIAVGKTASGGTVRKLLTSEVKESVRTKGDSVKGTFLPSAIEAVVQNGVDGYQIFIPRQPTQNDDQKTQNRITLGSSHGPKPAMIQSDEGRGRLLVELDGATYEVSYTATVMAQEVGAAKARRLANKAAK